MKGFDLSGSDDGLNLAFIWLIGNALVPSHVSNYYRCIVSGDGIMRCVFVRFFVYTNSFVRYRPRWTANEMGRKIVV